MPLAVHGTGYVGMQEKQKIVGGCIDRSQLTKTPRTSIGNFLW